MKAHYLFLFLFPISPFKIHSEIYNFTLKRILDDNPSAEEDNDIMQRNNSNHPSTNHSKKQELEFQENLLKKDGQLTEMDRVVRSLEDEMKRLRIEVNARRESEEQMKQVLKEYEKTISELIAEKEKERERFELEKSRLEEERDQAAQDLQNVEAAFADVHRKVSFKAIASIVYNINKFFFPLKLFT